MGIVNLHMTSSSMREKKSLGTTVASQDHINISKIGFTECEANFNFHSMIILKQKPKHETIFSLLGITNL